MKSKKPKISVIVPVYNTEKYLRRCIDSILNQTFADFEVLLINDGSTDSSGAICDEYAKQDSRIRVFHKENGGVSSARNVGLQNMKGEYSIHCDSDDWIELTMLENLYSKIKEDNVELLIFDYYEHTIAKQVVYREQKPSFLSSKHIIYDLLSGRLYGSLWNKMIKSDLYFKYNIQCPSDFNYCEDSYTLMQLLFHSNVRVGYSANAYYHYNRVEGSLSYSLNSENIDDYLLYNKRIDILFSNTSFFNLVILERKCRNKCFILNSAYKDNNMNYKNYIDIYPEINDFFIRSNIHWYCKFILLLSYFNCSWLMGKVFKMRFFLKKYIK